MVKLQNDSESVVPTPVGTDDHLVQPEKLKQRPLPEVERAGVLSHSPQDLKDAINEANISRTLEDLGLPPEVEERHQQSIREGRIKYGLPS